MTHAADHFANSGRMVRVIVYKNVFADFFNHRTAGDALKGIDLCRNLIGRHANLMRQRECARGIPYERQSAFVQDEIDDFLTFVQNA